MYKSVHLFHWTWKYTISIADIMELLKILLKKLITTP